MPFSLYPSIGVIINAYDFMSWVWEDQEKLNNGATVTGKNKSNNKNSNLFIFFLFRASFHNN